MKTVTSFPFNVTELRNLWIPLSDGIRLAGRAWVPEGSESDPVPAILEFIPYRQSDDTAYRDSLMHRYFAGHGYAVVRVDLRGSGNSDGVLEDEYLAQEQDDGIEVLHWIAEQAWCDGSVGMIGISWGGFNGLQIAARRPPELKAVISVCSTDDRYADDVHHMGGCLLGDNLSWASIMFAFNSMPPDPDVVGEHWRDMWFERLSGSGLWLEKWLRHQCRDDYWAHASVCEDYAAIQCPVYAISGWADGYSNAVFRLLANLSVPSKGLVGPWSHKYPHLGKPGPAIGFLQEAMRWWDRWLRNIDNGIMEEPRLRVWMQDSVLPTTSYGHRPGRWVAEPTWPSPDIDETEFLPVSDGLVTPAEMHNRQSAKEDEPRLTIQSPLTVGLFAGKWCSYAETPDLPHDQREEDGGALVFDTAPLAEPVEVLGAPVVDLVLSSNKPVAMVAVRISDLAPDDKATRITYGLLNLTHRLGHEQPKPLRPNTPCKVEVQLNHIAQVFPAGHRIRLAISTSYWPLAWPPPEPVRLTVLPDSSTLRLPVREPRDIDAKLPPFDEPEIAAPIERTLVHPTAHNWWVLRDLAKDESTLEVLEDDGTYRLEDTGLEYAKKQQEWYSSRGDDFESLRGETRGVRRLRRGEWDVETDTRTVLTCDAHHFYIHAELDAFENGRRVYSRNWDYEIPRDHV